MYPVSHKTVFVIDESPLFVGTSSNQAVEFDTINKSRVGGSQQQTYGSFPPIAKSLWTCCVESVAEYGRIVWDIYPDGDKLITYVRNSSAFGSQKFDPVLSWSESDQSLATFSKSMITTSREATEAKYAADRHRNQKPSFDDLVKGLKGAVSALGIPTDAQLAARIKSGKMAQFKNRGRIICLSYFRNEAEIIEIQGQLAEIINEYNESAKSSLIDGESKRIMVDQVDAVLINTHPQYDTGPSSCIRNVTNHLVTPFLTCEVHTTISGTYLSQKLTSLVLRHYNLASTTVTGIPMKEEQNASSSQNYDVEIFHPEAAHLDLYKIIAESLKIPKEGVEYESLPLKWCTPRSTTVELQYSTIAVRLTPVDVNSRPSSCLTNFLLSGRTVMLEMPKTKTSKIMSHMLCSHNNELYIHTICSSRTILEDPPSISEGTGGRVTDYRINDLGEFMKQNQLTRCKSDLITTDLKPNVATGSSKTLVGSKNASLVPFERSVQYLERSTIYWPIVLGHTIMFNIQSQIQSLIELIPKETLTLDDINQCKNAIYNVVSMESKNLPLAAPTNPFSNQSASTNFNTSGHKGKGPKREELYRMLYKELAHFISSYAMSPGHREVLAALNDLHSGSTTGPNHKSSSAHATESDIKGSGAIKASIIQSSGPLGTNGANQPSSKIMMNIKSEDGSSSTGWGSSSDHHMMYENVASTSCEPSKAKKSRFSFDQSSSSSGGVMTGGESLLSLWKKRLNYDASRKHLEFAGRSGPNNGSNICPLYLHLNLHENNGHGSKGPPDRSDNMRGMMPTDVWHSFSHSSLTNSWWWLM